MERFDPNDFARWLRQRAATRRARQGNISFRHEDWYDDYGPIEYDPKRYVGCLMWLVLAILLVLIVLWLSFCSPFDGDGPELTGDPIVFATTTTLGSTESTSSPTTTESPRRTFDDATLVAILEALGVTVDADGENVKALADAVGDLIDSISVAAAAYQGDDVDIRGVLAFLLDLDQLTADQTFNESTLECGQLRPLVVCAAPALPMPPGEVLVVAVEHAANIPIDAVERSYIYSLVFESDGDPSNDWQFNPPFDWDYFSGTDRWYQATYTHSNAVWFLDVTQVAAGGALEFGQPSSVRVVIDGAWVVWFVPTGELASYPASYRATAFGHDGAFTQDTRGGDVTGANPTEPLTAPPTETADLIP